MKLRRLLAGIVLALGLVAQPQAQIAVPNTLVAGTTITAAGLNTNFTTIANHALDRLSGGTISGNITLAGGVTIGGVDLAGTLCPTCAATFKDLTLASPATGLTVAGVNIINSTGKIPAISSTYFASLSGANLTALPAGQLTGTLPNATFPAVLPAVDGSQLTNLPAAPGVLSISHGGTNSTATPSAGAVAYGTGSAFAWTSAGSAGQYLLSNGTSAPSFGNQVTTYITSSATGAQDNWNPGLVGNTVLTMSNASLTTISGFAGGVQGQQLTILGTGAGQIDFLNNQISSAGNKLYNTIVANIPVSIGAGGVGGYVSYVYDGVEWRLVAHDQGIPIVYSPTWGNLGTGNTLGNGSITSSYLLHGHQVAVRILLSYGSTTVAGNGAWTFTLPVTADSGFGLMGSVTMNHGSTWQGTLVPNTASGFIVGTNGNPSIGFGTTNPFTWANGDTLAIGFWYWIT